MTRPQIRRSPRARATPPASELPICLDCRDVGGLHEADCPTWGLPPELLDPLRAIQAEAVGLLRAQGQIRAQTILRVLAVAAALQRGAGDEAIHHLDQVLQLQGYGPLQQGAIQGIWLPLSAPLRDVQRRYCRAVLRVSGGNRTLAAGRLRLNKRTLVRYLRQGVGDE